MSISSRPFYNMWVISYFSVVLLRGPSDKMLLFLWCTKINVVSFWVPLILLTRPFLLIWLSHISVQFYLGDLLKKCFYSYGVHKSLQFCSGYLSFYLMDPFTIYGYLIFQYIFRVPLILLTGTFYHILVSYISVQFYLGDLLNKCYYSCCMQKLMQFC